MAFVPPPQPPPPTESSTAPSTLSGTGSSNRPSSSLPSTPISQTSPMTTANSVARPPSKSGDAIDIRTRSPLPLTASQEGQVREIYYKNVRSRCMDEIREFAQCTSGRTISIAWACRSSRRAMNTCMLQFATREEEDRAREEWFAKIPERAKEAEEFEKAKQLAFRQKMEWWDMDEHGRRRRPDKGKGNEAG